jgi:hypothetical protein
LPDPLVHDRAGATGQILRHKVAWLRKQTLNYLRVALAAATPAEGTALNELDALARMM